MNQAYVKCALTTLRATKNKAAITGGKVSTLAILFSILSLLLGSMLSIRWMAETI